MEVILAKMGEMVLKGLNRRQFEDTMLKSLRYRLRPHGDFKVYAAQSTVYIEPAAETVDMDAAFRAASRVFGVSALCRAYACPKEMDAIFAAAAEHLAPALRKAGTFKVESKRSDKTFPFKSPEISREIGGRLHDAFDHLRVDVNHPEVTVYVEIR
ncbi:THUMP domain-containing protein, partial [Oscillospiraceae bacterium OttesenSCG-928-F05]|nr:THUMP domain-containing protein [Oscillospiraceae bacterium OttesenSCG-928-F05]